MNRLHTAMLTALLALTGCGESGTVSIAEPQDVQQESVANQLSRADRVLEEAHREIEAKETEVATLQDQVQSLKQSLQQEKRKHLETARTNLQESEEALEQTKQDVRLDELRLRASQMRFGMMTDQEQRDAMAAMKQAESRGPRSLNGYQVGLLYRIGTIETLHICDLAESRD